MSHLLFIVGIALCMGGVSFSIAGISTCLGIVRATRGRPDAVTYVETWLNTRQLSKWRKLRTLSSTTSDPVLQANATTVLRLDAWAIGLMLWGMMCLVLGAMAHNS